MLLYKNIKVGNIFFVKLTSTIYLVLEPKFNDEKNKKSLRSKVKYALLLYSSVWKSDSKNFFKCKKNLTEISLHIFI